MAYEEDLRMVATANIDEIEDDLEAARHALDRARGDVNELERRVASYELLASLGRGAEPGAPSSEGMTLHLAMAEVLRSTPGRMMRAGDLAREIERRRLYRMRDGRPVESQQVHARVNHYDDLFTKEGTFIKLRDEA